MKLSPLAEKFVVHFGEMGGRWGINRTTSRVFALLYLSPTPLHAGSLCEILGFSRSHVSIAIKELINWRLITMSHLPNDRRDHFSTVSDVWKIARILVEERRRREIEPTHQMLKEALSLVPQTAEEQHIHGKIEQMHNLLTMLNNWYEDMREMETEKLVRLLKLGSGVYKLYAKTSRLTDKIGGRSKQN